MDRDELVEVSFWHVNCNYFYLSFIAPQPNPTESGLENILFCKMGCIEKLDVGKLG